MNDRSAIERRDRSRHADLIDAARAISSYDAIRVLATRHEERDLSVRFLVSFHVEEARASFGWLARVRIRGFDKLRLLSSKACLDLDALELRIKSDAGSLELAGHSLSLPRSQAWRSATDVSFDAGCFVARAALAEEALFRIRRELCLRLERRIAHDVATLRSNGRPFDMADGWGRTVRHVDPTTIDVEGEGVAEPPRLLSDGDVSG